MRERGLRVRVGIVVGLVLGLVGFLVIGSVATAAQTSDVSEPHRLVAATSMGDIVPVGSSVLIECQQPNGEYLAEQNAVGATMLVFMVTAGQLDSKPVGPFPESCDHWQARHHVDVAAAAVPNS
jgi:hypothetical protein